MGTCCTENSITHFLLICSEWYRNGSNLVAECSMYCLKRLWDFSGNILLHEYPQRISRQYPDKIQRISREYPDNTQTILLQLTPILPHPNHPINPSSDLKKPNPLVLNIFSPANLSLKPFFGYLCHPKKLNC